MWFCNLLIWQLNINAEFKIPFLLAAKFLHKNLQFINYSLLAEGTGNTWWILLHNDRKSGHRRIKKQRRYERLAALWIIFETLNLKTQLSCVNLIVTNIFKNLQHSCYDIWIEYDHSCKMRLWKLKKAKLVFCRDRLQQVSERKKIT